MEREDLEHIRRRIDQRAAGDYMEFTIEAAGRTFRTPRKPMECWALKKTHGAHFAPEYSPCSIGYHKKYGADDYYHTDAVVGLQERQADGSWAYCFDHENLEECYGDSDEDARRAALWGMFFRVQETKLEFKCAVLSGDGHATGKVWHWLAPDQGPDWGDYTIFVIPHAGPEFLEAAETAIACNGAVITEAGGAMAHLANVGRERGLLLVRVEKARELYPQDTEVMVFCSSGEVKLGTHAI